MIRYVLLRIPLISFWCSCSRSSVALPFHWSCFTTSLMPHWNFFNPSSGHAPWRHFIFAILSLFALHLYSSWRDRLHNTYLCLRHMMSGFSHCIVWHWERSAQCSRSFSAINFERYLSSNKSSGKWIGFVVRKILSHSLGTEVTNFDCWSIRCTQGNK